MTVCKTRKIGASPGVSDIQLQSWKLNLKNKTSSVCVILEDNYVAGKDDYRPTFGNKASRANLPYTEVRSALTHTS